MSLEKEKLENPEQNFEKQETPSLESERIAGKLNKEEGIREETVQELTNSKLGVLKNTINVVNEGLENNDRVADFKNKKTETDKSLNTDNDLLSGFKPFQVNTEENIVAQNTSALKYTGRTLGNFAVGLGKGIINTPYDLVSLIKGEKIYKAPDLPKEFA